MTYQELKDLFSGERDEFGLESQALEFTVPGIETVRHVEVEVAVDTKKNHLEVHVLGDIGFYQSGFLSRGKVGMPVVNKHVCMQRCMMFTLGNCAGAINIIIYSRALIISVSGGSKHYS
jgi:hypothetical protein